MATPQKEYGLITRKKPTPILAAAPVRRLAAFASDSDDDSDTVPTGPSGPPKVNIALGELQQRQIRKAQEAALTADPTIFQYDELYDDLQEKREVQKTQQKPKDNKPKYIERLLKSADTRKKEYERRIERQVQKDREAEGEEFRDKESFVTSSYRAKLEEIRLAEEVEKRDEYLEAIGDVTKQRDLGGFYRHMYEQRMGDNKTDDATKDTGLGVTSTEKVDEKTSGNDKELRKERTYRKRKNSEPDEQPGEELENSSIVSKKCTVSDEGSTAKKVHIQSNLDADSDFSIDSSDSEDDAEKTANQADAVSKDENVFAKPHPVMGPIERPEKSETINVDSSRAVEDITEENAVPKVKVNIWLKRTVGDVLLGAIQRYYERKVAREAQ